MTFGAPPPSSTPRKADAFECHKVEILFYRRIPPPFEVEV